MSKKVRRLFAGFAPKHYRIQLNPDRDSMHLSGTVTVTGQKTDRPSQRLTFHQQGLKITNAHIVKHDKKGDRTISVDRINHHRTFDEVRLHADEILYPGEYTVHMEFAGEITRNMEGVYPCVFKHGGKEKKLIATQFESHHARSAFPCIDEPEAKATFELTLNTPIDETVISNTPVKDQTESDGKLVTTFETTPIMSTYLLAFVFGEMAYKEAKTKRGVTVRTYATPNNIEYTDFALQTAIDCLDFYEEYFDIDYPLAKCDFIALPDFASGAMENWGCITFREQAMLVDPDNTSLPTKQRVAEVVCHELTHQWFGNLVTMRWWTDLWLNEGFATWMSYLAIDRLFPQWEIWTQFISEEQQYALKLDALENTHPIEAPINHPDEIRTIFDAISYEKGGSCIHMLAAYLGDDMFRDGLRHYLRKHAYGNTDTTDLWQALETVSKKPVKDFMHTWTTQEGYPLVRAHITNSEVHLTQEQFLVNPAARERLADAKAIKLWPIAPKDNASTLPDLFTEEEGTFPVQKSSVEKPLMLNSGHSAFYRTVYNASHLEQLALAVKHGRISHIDRGGLLADTFEAAKAGYTDTAHALTLLEAYRNEDDDAVWDIIAGSIAAIRGVMDDDEIRESLKPYVQKLVATQLERLGWDAKPDESHFDTLLRPTILAMAAAAEQPDVMAEAKKRFEHPNTSTPDIRGVIYTTVARHGDAKTFDRLLAMHNESASSEERIKLTAALTNFKQPDLIHRALAVITTDDVRLQDSMYWIAYSFANRFAHKITWEWMVENWSWIEENLGEDLSFYRMPIYSARTGSDPNFLHQYKRFFETVSKPALERSINQGIEMIEWQTAWRQRDLATIKAFFAK